MAYSIPLINRPDNFEVVRDAVADILAAEGAAQQVLASAAELDPNLWAFRVYAERSAPWDSLCEDDPTPIINVWFDSMSFDPRSSNQSTRQMAKSTRINVDCYALAITGDVPGGQTPADEASTRTSHLAVRLARGILMHDKYVILGLDGVVSRRWVESITSFQPADRNGYPVASVMAARIALEVDHVETCELSDEETLELINIKMHHDPDGRVIAEMNLEA